MLLKQKLAKVKPSDNEERECVYMQKSMRVCAKKIEILELWL